MNNSLLLLGSNNQCRCGYIFACVLHVVGREGGCAGREAGGLRGQGQFDDDARLLIPLLHPENPQNWKLK